MGGRKKRQKSMTLTLEVRKRRKLFKVMKMMCKLQKMIMMMMSTTICIAYQGMRPQKASSPRLVVLTAHHTHSHHQIQTLL